MKHPYRHRIKDWFADMLCRWTYCISNGHVWSKEIPYCLNCGKDKR